MPVLHLDPVTNRGRQAQFTMNAASWLGMMTAASARTCRVCGARFVYVHRLSQSTHLHQLQTRLRRAHAHLRADEVKERTDAAVRGNRNHVGAQTCHAAEDERKHLARGHRSFSIGYACNHDGDARGQP